MTPATRRSRWIDPLVAFILIFIVPGCWSAALAGATLEHDTALLSSTTDEESEKHELVDEVQAVRGRARPLHPPRAAVATAPKQKPVTHQAPAPLASVAPKAHPSRLSVRRQQ